MDDNPLNQSCAPAIDIKSSMEKEEGKYGSYSTEKNNDIINDIVEKLESVITILSSLNISKYIINDLNNINNKIKGINIDKSQKNVINKQIKFYGDDKNTKENLKMD